MLTKHLALVCMSKKVSPSELAQTAAALQKQITRDLGPLWNLQATIDYFPSIKDVPLGYWPIIIAEDIHEPGALGFHTDKNHQPFSLVKLDDLWQLTCSHEMCEMLVDPYGNKLVSAGSKDTKQGKVNYLVEVCDPCEDASLAYSINGILVSDFYTPHYFDPTKVPGVRYSYTGAITQPREVKKNGYLTWQDPVTKKWYQETYFGSKPVIKVLNGMNEFGHSLRSQVDKLTTNPNGQKAYQNASKEHASVQRKIFQSGTSMSDHWSSEIGKLMKPMKSKKIKTKLANAIGGQTAIIDVTFNLGVGTLTVKHFRGAIELNSDIVGSYGKSIQFEDVLAGDFITIDGVCAGEAIVSLNLDSFPKPQNPYVKNINDQFQISIN